MGLDLIDLYDCNVEVCHVLLVIRVDEDLSDVPGHGRVVVGLVRVVVVAETD